MVYTYMYMCGLCIVGGPRSCVLERWGASREVGGERAERKPHHHSKDLYSPPLQGPQGTPPHPWLEPSFILLQLSLKSFPRREGAVQVKENGAQLDRVGSKVAAAEMEPGQGGPESGAQISGRAILLLAVKHCQSLGRQYCQIATNQPKL